MTLTHDTNHREEAVARLCQQYVGNEGVIALLDAHSEGIQLLEDALLTLQTKRLPLDSATGVQLDGIGDIVGQIRNGMSDTLYCLWLKARMLANVSAGCPETLIAIVRVITGSMNPVQVVGVYPAGVLLLIAGELPTTASDLAQILGQAVAAGVSLQFVYSTTDDAHTFTFADGDAEQASTDEGWATDDQSAGGLWADVQVGS
jgi:hypothetical protein